MITKEHKRLSWLIKDGYVWSDGSTYWGHASNGVDVSIGAVGSEDQVEKYLRDYPAPKDWQP